MKKMIEMNAGRSLRVLMEEKDLSCEQLVKDLGVSRMTISTLRRNKLISGSNIEMLANYFGITPSEFIRKGEVSDA